MLRQDVAVQLMAMVMAVATTTMTMMMMMMMMMIKLEDFCSEPFHQDAYNVTTNVQCNTCSTLRCTHSLVLYNTDMSLL